VVVGRGEYLVYAVGRADRPTEQGIELADPVQDPSFHFVRDKELAGRRHDLIRQVHCPLDTDRPDKDGPSIADRVLEATE
jgi:hypothetical protein